MPILRSMEGKYYDLPDEQASSFEVPKEKLKELFEKAGMPATQSQPHQQQQGAPSGAPASGPGGSGHHGAPHSAPVVVQIYAAPPAAGAGAPPPDQQGQQQAPQSADGEVDPYWITYWWRNFYYRPWGNWGNGWGNW